MSRCGHFCFRKESLQSPWGVPGGSLGVPGASLGGPEACLGVDVSATDRFVMYTRKIEYVFVISPLALTLIDGHPSVTTVAGLGLQYYTTYNRKDIVLVAGCLDESLLRVLHAVGLLAW